MLFDLLINNIDRFIWFKELKSINKANLYVLNNGGTIAAIDNEFGIGGIKKSLDIYSRNTSKRHIKYWFVENYQQIAGLQVPVWEETKKFFKAPHPAYEVMTQAMRDLRALKQKIFTFIDDYPAVNQNIANLKLVLKNRYIFYVKMKKGDKQTVETEKEKTDNI